MPNHAITDDQDLIERALKLIEDGAPPRSELRDFDLFQTLDDYFRPMVEADLRLSLTELAADDARADMVQSAVKVLVAFFRWAEITSTRTTADGIEIRSLAADFALALSRRLAPPRSQEPGDSPLLFEWQQPDVALGWRNPPGRPQAISDPGLRLEIVALWEDLAAEGLPAADRERRIAERYGVKRTALKELLKDHELERAFLTQPSQP